MDKWSNAVPGNGELFDELKAWGERELSSPDAYDVGDISDLIEAWLALIPRPAWRSDVYALQALLKALTNAWKLPHYDWSFLTSKCGLLLCDPEKALDELVHEWAVLPECDPLVTILEFFSAVLRDKDERRPFLRALSWLVGRDDVIQSRRGACLELLVQFAENEGHSAFRYLSDFSPLYELLETPEKLGSLYTRILDLYSCAFQGDPSEEQSNVEKCLILEAVTRKIQDGTIDAEVLPGVLRAAFAILNTGRPPRLLRSPFMKAFCVLDDAAWSCPAQERRVFLRQWLGVLKERWTMFGFELSEYLQLLVASEQQGAALYDTGMRWMEGVEPDVLELGHRPVNLSWFRALEDCFCRARSPPFDIAKSVFWDETGRRLLFGYVDRHREPGRPFPCTSRNIWFLNVAARIILGSVQLHTHTLPLGEPALCPSAEKLGVKSYIEEVNRFADAVTFLYVVANHRLSTPVKDEDEDHAKRRCAPGTGFIAVLGHERISKPADVAAKTTFFQAKTVSVQMITSFL